MLKYVKNIIRYFVINFSSKGKLNHILKIFEIKNLMLGYMKAIILDKVEEIIRTNLYKLRQSACSVGNMSEEMIRKYIENQG